MAGTAGYLPWLVTSGNHSSQSTGRDSRDRSAEKSAGPSVPQEFGPRLIPPPPFDRAKYCVLQNTYTSTRHVKDMLHACHMIHLLHDTDLLHDTPLT